MCGRFMLNSDPADIAAEFSLAAKPVLKPRYNIAPSQPVLTIRNIDRERAAAEARWGLVPSWSKDRKIGNRLINARAETVASKPAFRAAYRRRRCLVPADGYYEWRAQSDAKQPFFIYATAGTCFAIAGLWEHWQQDDEVIESCTLITCEANQRLSGVHGRMPVVIGQDDYNLWLDDEADPAALGNLLQPAPESRFTMHAVSTRVNSPRNDSIECIVAVEV